MNRAAVPTYSIDTSNLPVDQRFDAYASAIKAVWDPKLPAEVPANSNWASSYWEVGSFVFCTFDLGPLRATRDHRHINLVEDKYILLHHQDSGKSEYSSGQGRVSLRKGRFNVLDMGSPFTLEQVSRTLGQSVFIPRSLLGVGRLPSLKDLAFSQSEPTGTLMSASIAAVFNSIHAMSDVEATRLTDGLAALIKHAVFNRPIEGFEAELARETAAHSVYQFIDRHITDRDLGVQSICRSLNLSRTTLYRMMGERGGVMQVIKERRLDATMDVLAAAIPTAGRVREVAERFGYSDQALFSRQFKIKFGVSPSTILGIRYNNETSEPNRDDEATVPNLHSRPIMGRGIIDVLRDTAKDT